MRRLLVLLASVHCAWAANLPSAEGYTGIWYYNQPSKDEYRYKYSGGMATYPQQHAPIAIYAPAVRKTFFVYGGSAARRPSDKQELLHMVSFFDHETRTVPRPRILLNKKTDDAHDNPVLSIDGAGHLWIFSPSHGTARPSYIHRSARPYDISAFERVAVTNFSYPQPWWLPGRGFLFLHTRYGRMPGVGVRALYSIFSRDGVSWTDLHPLANIAQGDYQVSWPARGQRLGTAFDQHPPPLGLNARANIYYVETRDGGANWSTVAGDPLALPLTNAANAALVFDSVSLGRLVYLKDLNFDVDGRPVILFLLSRGFESGPANGPREWMTTRWTGTSWETRAFTASGNNYDHGSLYIELDGAWRVIAPTDSGPQPGNPGGEMVMWLSRDQGKVWLKHRQLTKGSARNHTYARRPLHAHPDFYALWADGNARQPSESGLYFTDRDGSAVWQLPSVMDAETATPVQR
jgi:hypothetical protein